MSSGERCPARLWIGTSGWTYPHWRGGFYPQELASSEYLRYYATQFQTTEINYSFYHRPRPETFRKWWAETPDDFVFAVKVHRSITHIGRLRCVESEWKCFLDSASALGAKLGPFLLQFPASFRCDLGLLAEFLEFCREGLAGKAVRIAFEFRHPSWFNAEVVAVLRRSEAALVIADSSRYPRAPLAATADFMYLRFHGPGALFASSYGDEDLRIWADRIRHWLRDGLDVHAYFNNDLGGSAIGNARTLRTWVVEADAWTGGRGAGA